MDPQTLSEALAGPDAALWQAAYDAEVRQLIDTGTIRKVHPPEGASVLPHKVVLQAKHDETGTMVKAETTLVILYIISFQRRLGR